MTHCISTRLGVLRFQRLGLWTALGGMRLLPTNTFAESPKLDLICQPGGAGMNALLNDEETLDFVRRQGSGARYVTSVCTGSLVAAVREAAAARQSEREAAVEWAAARLRDH